jgi:creatinine amidohydrolase
MKLAEMLRPTAEPLADGAVVAVLPTGAVEQHSRHLPLGTDAMLATAVAERLEVALPDDVLLMPTLWYGASGHHAGFSGTVSVGTDPLVTTASAALRSLSATSGIRRFIIVNGHGGNQPAVRVIVERLRDELPEITVWGLDYWGKSPSGIDIAVSDKTN